MQGVGALGISRTPSTDPLQELPREAGSWATAAVAQPGAIEIGGHTFAPEAVDSGFFIMRESQFNKCLDADRNGAGDGTRVQIWDCNSSSQQQWTYVSFPLAQSLQNRVFVKCLDVDINGGNRNGTKVQLWTCNQSSQQDWWQAGAEWHNVWAGGKCPDVDILHEGVNSTRGQVWDCNGELQQRWFIA